MKLSSAKWIYAHRLEEKKMRRSRVDCYYYECTPESFVINTEDECISINHFGDNVEIPLYEIGEIGIDFNEENDYVLKIRYLEECHMFQFVNNLDAIKVCIEILNQISLLPEHRDTLTSS
jgi:hypothetical protein